MKLPPLILASASPRRAEMLQQMKLEFEIVPSDAPEIIDDYLSPLELCQLNAHRKARAVAKKIPDALVLAADTLVFVDHQIFGKPADLGQAKKMLLQLQGRTHQVVTGVSLIHLRPHHERIFAASTDVVFRALTPELIDEYLAKVNPLDKAGAYAIQEHGEFVISEISGSFSNVVGLPMEQLQSELESWPAD
ncbi:MAG TPA: Maf family protein [Verrucomicrobiae bacterium]|nr:Maf family protein [Verrucomicrobiae bacterium]